MCRKARKLADIKKECPLIFPITIRENNKISSDFGYFDGKN